MTCVGACRSRGLSTERTCGGDPGARLGFKDAGINTRLDPERAS